MVDELATCARLAFHAPFDGKDMPYFAAPASLNIETGMAPDRTSWNFICRQQFWLLGGYCVQL
jgi:hypothetical protein